MLTVLWYISKHFTGKVVVNINKKYILGICLCYSCITYYFIETKITVLGFFCSFFVFDNKHIKFLMVPKKSAAVLHWKEFTFRQCIVCQINVTYSVPFKSKLFILWNNYVVKLMSLFYSLLMWKRGQFRIEVWENDGMNIAQDSNNNNIIVPMGSRIKISILTNRTELDRTYCNKRHGLGDKNICLCKQV